jgi:PadR family transcriptional regulator PadR
MIDQKYISDYKKQTGERMVKVYYHLEDVGRERLEALVSEYREFSQVMNEILNLK